jgi:hypothetical protein
MNPRTIAWIAVVAVVAAIMIAVLLPKDDGGSGQPAPHAIDQSN